MCGKPLFRREYIKDISTELLNLALPELLHNLSPLDFNKQELIELITTELVKRNHSKVELIKRSKNEVIKALNKEIKSGELSQDVNDALKEYADLIESDYDSNSDTGDTE